MTTEQEERIKERDEVFIPLLNFVFCENEIIDLDEYPVLHNILNKISKDKGYRDWIDAWHHLCFGKG